MGLKLANNAISRLSAGISPTDVTIVLVPGGGAAFPTLGAGDYFPATIVKADGTLEIVKVTARAADVFTVVRAQENTTAKAFNAGDRIELRLTAGTYAAQFSDVDSRLSTQNNLRPSGTALTTTPQWSDVPQMVTDNPELTDELNAQAQALAERTEMTVRRATVPILSFDGTNMPDKALIHFADRKNSGDGAGGQLRFLKGSTAPANNVTVYAVNGGRLVREGWSAFGINVLWAGAVGDGVTDDTEAVQAAIDASAGYFGGTHCEVLFPNGNYVIGNLRLRTGTRLRGTSKYGCWLTAKAGATSMIETEYNAGIGLNFRNQWAIECFTIRYDGLVSATTSAALRLWNSYGNSIRDCYIYADNQLTSAAWGIWFGQGVYTTLIENVECKRVRVYSATADRPTTLTFVGWDGGVMDIDNAGAITLVQPVVQSRVGEDYGTYRISVKNCFSFNATGGDYEDDDPSHFIYYFDNVTNHLVSMGNWTTGFAGGYAAYGPTGIAPTCKVLLQDDKNAGFEYREGNWTPSLSWSSPGTSTITMPTVGGSYVKNGNIVTCTFYVDNAEFVNGTATGYLVLSGLPFTAVAGVDSWGGTPTLQIGYPTNMQSIQVLAGTKTAAFKKADGSASNVVVADVSGAGKFLRGTFTYKCVN